MKKTMLSISIMTAMLSFNAFAISNEDLLNFDNILNDTETTQEVEKTPELIKIDKNIVEKKMNIFSKKEIEQKKEIPIVKVPSTNKVETNIEENDKIILPDANKPTIIVPVSGQSVTLKINLMKDKLVRETIAKTEVVLYHTNEIDDKFKNEEAIIDFIQKQEAFANYTMYETDKDILTGIESSIVEGKLVKKEILSDIKKGFSYFVKIVEKDKRNNRVKLRIDINIIDVNSNTELSLELADGSHQKIRLPNMKETNSSKEFWFNLDSPKQVSYKIDDIHKLTIDLQRDIPFIQQVFVPDHEKIKILEIEAAERLIQEEKDKKEAERRKILEKDSELYNSLEDMLKK